MTVTETIAYLADKPYLTTTLRRNGRAVLLASSKETKPGRWLLDWLEYLPEASPIAPWLLMSDMFDADDVFTDA